MPREGKGGERRVKKGEVREEGEVRGGKGR